MRRSLKWGGGIVLGLIVLSTFAEDPEVPTAAEAAAPGQPVAEEEAPPPPAEFNARVRTSDDGTSIEVTNLNDYDWADCEVSINPGVIRGGWSQQVSYIPAGDVVSGGIMAFTDSQGARFNPNTHVIEKVSVICQDTPVGIGAFFGGR